MSCQDRLRQMNPKLASQLEEIMLSEKTSYFDIRRNYEAKPYQGRGISLEKLLDNFYNRGYEFNIKIDLLVNKKSTKLQQNVNNDNT